jgi:putative peptide zinc metalloprotease protein
MIGIGIKAVFDNFEAVKVQYDGVLALSNIPFLYVAISFVKIIHELGHAFAVRRFGGEVHTIGVMFLLLTPLPYTDASGSIAFRSKWHRMLVGASGMIFELFIAAIAAVVWAKTGDGVVHSLAYNILFAASVTTLIFNINPLMRYDGYYMLCDLIEIPNLQQLSTQQMKYVLEKFAFGKKDVTPPVSSSREGWFLSIFSISSFVYRMIVFSGILIAISKKMLLLAVIMGLFMMITWIGVPLSKFLKYITRGSELQRIRGRALRVSFTVLGVLICIIAYLPIPYSFKAPGVLKAVGFINTVNKTTGKVVSYEKADGSTVKKGDTLFILDNTELRNQLTATQAALQEATLQYNKALYLQQADLNPIEQRIAAYSKRLKFFTNEVDNLVVRAEIDGVWIAPDADDFTGRWVPRGTTVGRIIDHKQFYFASAISQADISSLFTQDPRSTEVRLFGQSNCPIQVSNINIIPMEQNQLPSSALGFSGGGEIAVVPQDSSGKRTIEPFYEVRAVVATTPDVSFLHGRSGKIRFFLGYKPLLWQGWRRLLQLFQKHYRL